MNTEEVSARSIFISKLHQTLDNELSGQSEWRIDARELAGRIPEMKHKFPSHIVPAVKSALNRINNQYRSNLALEVDRSTWGQATLIFSHKSNGGGLQEATQENRPKEPVRPPRLHKTRSTRTERTAKFHQHADPEPVAIAAIGPKAEPATTPSPIQAATMESQPVGQKTGTWESYISLLKDAFSLYHITFANLAETNHTFVKWGKASKAERDVMMAALEAQTWKKILHSADSHMNSLSPEDQKHWRNEAIRALSDFSSNKRIATLVSYMLHQKKKP